MQTLIKATTGQMVLLKQKSLGQSIMVSDFIEEKSNDFLHIDSEYARLCLETQSEEYFDSVRFLKQVEKAIDIFEHKDPNHQAVFLFDNAPSHCKCSNNSLNVNVNPGGRQPVMRDTVWNDNVQKLVDSKGIPKGLKLVLEERGLSTDGLNAKAMRDILGKHEDFKNQTTLVEELIASCSHLCFFPLRTICH